MPEKSAPRHLVLIAGRKSHGPEGNGIHDYPWDARVAAAMLQRSDVGAQITGEVVDGWPEDPAVLARADAIALFCDGRDGDRFGEALHLADQERSAAFDALMQRGCGLGIIHFGIFAPEAQAERCLSSCGGYFQWQGPDGSRDWRSQITRLEAMAQPAAPEHPCCRGVEPFRLADECYHDLRFATDAPDWTPILRVPDLPAQREHGDVVAWTRERPDGGRSFGTALGHDHRNWRCEPYRRFLLNGLAWISGVEIPEGGVTAPPLDRDAAALSLRAADDDRLRVLLLTGNDAHRWHRWEESTPAITAALERDPRIAVTVVTDARELGQRDLRSYDCLALNYCNWKDPSGLDAASQRALLGYVADGGGLLVLHFSGAAFHRSLPEAGASHWPDYHRLVRRCWDHDGDSGHDRFGTFIAHPRGEHPIVAGLTSFAVEDELYYRQSGDASIDTMLTARSRDTGADEPLAWAYRHGRGRVFHTLLGHDARCYRSFGSREMLRRAAAWCADRELRPLHPTEDEQAVGSAQPALARSKA